MRKDSERKLISLGFDTGLIKKIDEKSLTLSGLRGQSKEALTKNGFTDEETELILEKINRKEIDDQVINNILSKSGEICCFCNDGNNARPFQIHHIKEYHIDQDNSEENLVLICPTHHVTIHKNKTPIDTQKQIKRKWEFLWSVAIKYKEKSITFPFDAIECVDYGKKGDLTEIFSFGTPSPSVCAELCRGLTAREAILILNENNNLIISGESGSGKSTLAYGIAGFNEDRKVFRFTIGNSNELKATEDILYFLSEVIGNVTLIIDDANVKLSFENLEKILGVCQSDKQIIITNTRNDFKGNSNIEQHFPKSVKHIEWNKYQQSVKESLISKEADIVEYLKNNELDKYNDNTIGFSGLNYTLSYVMDDLSNYSDSVWQFIYLLGGGLKMVNKIQEEMHSKDRFDIVFLFIAIKQIAEFERGTSIDEILELYERNSILITKGIPETSWLKEQLDIICSTRILKCERGRYKTIHRQYARRYIESFYLKHLEDCNELLDEIFSDSNKAKEIIILWSWLDNSKLNSYLFGWWNKTDINYWKNVVSVVCELDLELLGILARQMHWYSTSRGVNSKRINEAFKDKAQNISKLINKADKNTLYFFNELSTMLRYHVSELFIPLLNKIDKIVIANLIKNSESTDFEFINYLFYNISEFYPDWIRELSTNFEFNDFINIFEKTQKGDVDSIYEIVYFIRRYILNFKRSHLKYCTSQIKRVLSNCPLNEINYSIISTAELPELLFFQNDLLSILDSLDTNQIARDLATTTPRNWEKLLYISIYTSHIKSSVMQEIIDKIDENVLCRNIEKYYLGSLYEFRILIHQLSYGSHDKKISLSQKLKPFIETICKNYIRNEEIKHIIYAYNKLNANLAKEVAEMFNLEIIDDKDKNDEEREMDPEIVAKINSLESGGEDYELDSNLI